MTNPGGESTISKVSLPESDRVTAAYAELIALVGSPEMALEVVMWMQRVTTNSWWILDSLRFRLAGNSDTHTDEGT